MVELDRSRLGQCFELSGLKLMQEEDHAVTATLVHGTISRAGFVNPHAWVEYEEGSEFGDDPGIVWEPASDEIYPRPIFYYAFQAELHFRYTSEQMSKWALKAKHWGPWEGDYWEKLGKAVIAREAQMEVEGNAS